MSRRFVLGGVLVALAARRGRAAEGEKPKPVPGAPIYVRFAPIFVPVIQGDSVTRQVGVVLVLELDPKADKDKVEAKRRQLVDAFMSFLYPYFQQRPRVDQAIDQVFIKDRLRLAAARVLGPEAIKEVLIQQLFVQAM